MEIDLLSRIKREIHGHHIDFLWLIFGVLFLIVVLKNLVSKRNILKTLIVSIVLLSLPQTRVPIILSGFVIGCLLFGGKFSEKYAHSTYNIAFNIKQNLPIPNNPSIFLFNYPACFLGYQVFHSLSPNIVILCTKAAKKLFKPILRGINIIESNTTSKDNFNRIRAEVKKYISMGYNIVVYPEKDWLNRKNIHSTTKLIQSGIFQISKDLNIPILPIVISHFNVYSGIIKNRDLYIHVDKQRVVKNVPEEMKKVRQLFERKLRKYSFKYYI